MRTHARAVVIGGGVVGVSTLYHLCKKGWTDSVLVERKELTSGSTWHAAGLLPLFNLSYSVGQIHKYSVALYKTLEKETGLDVGFRQVSNIRLARTRDRLDEYHYYAGVAATIGGIEVKFLTPAEVKEIWPLCNVDGIIGAIQHPAGRLHPAGRPHPGAGARRARPRRRDQPADDGHRDRAAAERRMEGRHRQGRHRLRARRLRYRAISPGRPAAWSGSTSPSFRCSTSTSSPRRIPRSSTRKAQGLPEMGVLREVGFVLVHARGGGRPAARALRGRRAGLLCRRALGGQRIRALPRGPRPPRAPYRDRDRARARLRRGRRQEGLQRRHRLYAGRLADRRPRAGREELLAQRGPFVRRHRRRRRRLAARRMDRRGRADRRHARRRSAPLRPLRADGLSRSRRTRRPTQRSSPCTIPTRSASPRGLCGRRRATTG